MINKDFIDYISFPFRFTFGVPPKLSVTDSDTHGVTKTKSAGPLVNDFFILIFGSFRVSFSVSLASVGKVFCRWHNYKIFSSSGFFVDLKNIDDI